MLRVALGLVVMLAAATDALAHPPPDPGPAEIAQTERPTLIEWTTWVRGGVVVAHAAPRAGTLARTTSDAPTREANRTVSGALGAGFTLPIGSSARVGPWIELRGWGMPLVGGELTVIPGALDMFFYKGTSAVTLRGGANPDVRTAQLGLAYRAPWDLYGQRPRASRYMIGVGVVATVTQSRSDPHDWSALVGLELEPLGAIRYLLGIRSWY